MRYQAYCKNRFRGGYNGKDLLLYYFNIQTLSNKSDGDLKLMLMEAYELPPEEVENNKRAYL